MRPGTPWSVGTASIIVLALSGFGCDHTCDRLQKACDGGDMGSCNKLGEFTARGGCSGLIPAAMDQVGGLYGKACGGGIMAACTNLGLCHAIGVCGVSKDDKLAGDLYRRACKGGDARGCALLGDCYARDDNALEKLTRTVVGYPLGNCGVHPDKQQAIELYHKACDGGDVDTCNKLGLCYQHGSCGWAEDQKQARESYQKACDGGKWAGCANLRSL